MTTSERTFKVNTDFTDLHTSIKGLMAGMDKLAQKMDEFGQRATQNMNRSSQGSKKAKADLTLLNAEYRKLNAEFAKIMRSQGQLVKGTSEYKRQVDRLREINAQLKILRNQGANGIDKVTASTKKLASAQASVNKQVSLGRQLFLRLKSVMLTVFGAYAIIQSIRNTINTIKDFELGIARVQAITGATSEEIKRLAESAKVLAETGIFNPTEITELQVKLAKLGFTIEEISNSTQGIIDLATATGEDLAVAAETVASVIRGLGLDASETGRIVDVLGKSFTTSALDINKFRESAKYILPLARQMGWTIEEVSALLGKLADSLISGSLAGTGLRTLFVELANKSSKLSALMGEGVETFDDFINALVELQEQGTTTAQILEAVPKRAVTLTAVLLAQGEGLRDYKKRLDDVSGAIKEMSDIQMRTLANQLERLGSAWDSFILSLQDSGGVLAEAVRGLSELLNIWSFQLNPASRGLANASKVVNQFKESIKGLTAEQKFDEATRVIKELGVVINELDNITRKSDNTIAFLADLREQINLLTEFKEKTKIDIEIDNITKSIIKSANILESKGVSSSKAFEIAYNEALEKIIQKTNSIESELKKKKIEIGGAVGISPEFNAAAQRQLDAQADADRDFWSKVLGGLQAFNIEKLQLLNEGDAQSKDFFKRQLDRNRLIELQTANLIQNERIKAERILEINQRYSKLSYDLDIKYDDLTVQEINDINTLKRLLEENYQKDLLDLREKFNDEDLAVRQKAFEDFIKLQETYNATVIQEMENAGASAEDIARKQILLEIKLLKLRIKNAELLGLSASDIAAISAEIDKLGVKLDGITGEDVVAEVEDNTDKIASAYKKLASEIIDTLESIADAQVENSERLLSDLDTRIAETQRALDTETQLFVAGYANNVTAKKKELAELKSARDKALKEREAAVKRQQAIESISQAISLGSATAKVISTYVGVPGAGLAIAAGVIAGLLALFATTQAKIKGSTQYGEGGKVDGKSHAQGGVAAELEGGEYVIKKSAYAKHAGLIHAINTDTLPTLNQSVLNSSTFEKKDGDVILEAEVWNRIESLLADNLKGEKVMIQGNKKIITSGIKKRIITNV